MLLYITGGVGFVLCILAIVLVLLFHAKDKSKVLPIIVFVAGFVVFMGSGFMHWRGIELKLPEKKPEDVQQIEDQDLGNVDNDDSTSDSNTTSANDDEPTSTPAIEPVAQEPDTIPEPVPVSNFSGALGDYYVEIKDAVIVSDYDGNPAVVITYAWTNNSEETTSAEVVLMEKAFQDGVQLSTAYIGDASVYNSELSFKDLRPGTTFDVQCAFELTSNTSEIEFELSELFSFSDDVVNKNFDPTQLN